MGRSAKRHRLTKSGYEQLDRQILEVLRDDHPQSVRHVFYRLTDPRLPVAIPKTEKGYKQVGRRLVKLRNNGTVPYSWITDSTRMGYHVRTYEDQQDFLSRTLGFYRLNEWKWADTHVEVWCESRSLVGALQGTCERLGVSLYPCGGFSSETLVWDAAQDIKAISKPVVLLYVGDYDPAGVLIDQDVGNKMSKHLPDHDVTLRRVALTPEQIKQYDLPTKPRKETDRRRLDITETVEAEALPAAEMRALVETAVDEYLDPDTRARVRASEDTQRGSIWALRKHLPEGVVW